MRSYPCLMMKAVLSSIRFWFPNFAQMLILLQGVLEDRIANLFCRLSPIASRITSQFGGDPARRYHRKLRLYIETGYLPGYQRNFRHVCRINQLFPDLHREILVPGPDDPSGFPPSGENCTIWSSSTSMNFLYSARKYQRRRMTEINKAEMSVRTQLTVNHRGDFARILIRIPSKRVPCGHWTAQA